MYVGLKFAERENTLADFALAVASLPWLAVLASIIAAETSAATFLGAPGEGFKLLNYSYLQILVGTVLGPHYCCLPLYKALLRSQCLFYL
jgi:SSS family solute:Na+ symporter